MPPPLKQVDSFVMQKLLQFLLFPFQGIIPLFIWLVPQLLAIVVEFVFAVVYMTGSGISEEEHQYIGNCSFLSFTNIYLLLDSIVWLVDVALRLLLGWNAAKLLLQNPPSILTSPFHLIDFKKHPVASLLQQLSFILTIVFRIFYLCWGFAGTVGLSVLRTDGEHYCVCVLFFMERLFFNLSFSMNSFSSKFLFLLCISV